MPPEWEASQMRAASGPMGVGEWWVRLTRSVSLSVCRRDSGASLLAGEAWESADWHIMVICQGGRVGLPNDGRMPG